MIYINGLEYIYFLLFLSNIDGGDIGILVVLMPFWFRLVNKAVIVIGPVLKKASEGK